MKTLPLIGLLAALSLAAATSACGTSGDGTPDAGNAAVPGAPTGFMAMEMGSAAHLMWNDTFSDETAFELQRKDSGDFRKLVEVPANETAYMDESVQVGVTYTYRMRALSAAGPGAWSSEATYTLETAMPGAPSNLAVMLMSGGVHVSWRDNSSDETGFEVQRKVDAGDFAALESVAANSRSVMDMNAPAGHKYTYRVRATKAEGATDWSNEASMNM